LSYAIETLNLSKRFPLTKRYRELILNPFSHPETTALDNITISVSPGEVFGVLGPNGSGKTTLIKILSTLILPTTGKAFVNSMDVAANEKEIKKYIGYVVSDERSFFWRLTGRQNLCFFASLNNITAKDTDRKIKEIASLMGLEKELDNVFQNYSSGNKQKVAIARGLLTNPKILFLDEPTRNLDPVAAHTLRQFIKHTLVADSGKTVFIATNNMQETEEICDRVAFLQEGKVIKSGTIEEMKRLSREKYTLRLNTTMKQVESSTSHPDCIYNICSLYPSPMRKEIVIMIVEISSEKENISDVIDFLVGKGIKIEACEYQKQPLHQLFTKGSDE
jgi:ABC-2 type transport system ATP-binding protein